MRVALACGQPDVDEFMASVTSDNFDELMAYDAVEGIGNDRIVRVLAMGFAAVLSALSGKTIKPDAFLPKYRPQRAKRTYDDVAAEQIAAIRSSLGGR